MHGSEITQITIFDSLSPGNAAMPQSSKIMFLFFFVFFFGDFDSAHFHLPTSSNLLGQLKIKKKCFLCHGTDSMAPF